VRHDSRFHLIAPFALLDPLLRCAALVAEGDDALGRPRQVDVLLLGRPRGLTVGLSMGSGAFRDSGDVEDLVGDSSTRIEPNL
jgi:hypothetical protein